MSERAIEYLDSIVNASHEEVVAACQARDLAADYPLEVHTIANRPLMGVEPQVADYINPVVTMITAAIKKKHASGAIMIPDQQVTVPQLGGNLMPRVLSTKIKTGKIAHLMIEVITEDELPGATRASLRGFRNRLVNNQQTLDEFSTFYQITGWGKIGGNRDIRLGGAIGVYPHVTVANEDTRTVLSTPVLGRSIAAIRYPESMLKTEAVWNQSAGQGRFSEAIQMSRAFQAGAGSLGKSKRSQ